MCVSCFASPDGHTDPTSADASPFPAEAPPLPFGTGDPAGGTLRWTGVAGLRFDLDGTAIAFDPFVSRPGLAAALFRPPRPRADAVRARFSNLDAVFVGHTHYDHAMDLAAVAEASPRARIHGSRTTVELGRRLGIESRRLVLVQDGRDVEVGPFCVQTIASEHGVVPVVRHIDRVEMPAHGLPWTPFRYPRGDVYAWRVEAGERTFHVQGSAGIDDDALGRQAPVDVLLACLAARHGTPLYLDRLGVVLRPGLLVPIHHDDFFRPIEAPPQPVKGLDWPAFLDDARRLEKAHGTRLVLPAFDSPHAW